MKFQCFTAAPYSRAAALVSLAFATAPLQAGVYQNDFSTDPFSPTLPANQRLTIFSNQGTGPNRPTWVSTGGQSGGYVKLTDALNDIRSTIVFPDFESGFAVGGFKFAVDCRIGGGSANPADGFSISFAGASDPVVTTGDGYAGGGHEEGTASGIAVSFDAYQNNDSDIPSVSVKVNGALVANSNFEMPVRNGTLTNHFSMQTGPLVGSTAAERLAALGWARFEVDLRPNPDPLAIESHLIDVSWKGVKVINALPLTYTPQAGRLVFGSRTGGANQAHHFDNVSLETFPVPRASVSSATISHEAITFQISDFGTTSTVAAADITSILVDNVDIKPTATITKTGGITTITYVPTTPFTGRQTIFYDIVAEDQNGNPVERFGDLIAPVFPKDFYLTTPPTLNRWDIREIRGGLVNSNPPINSAIALAPSTPAAPPSGGQVVEYTAPFFNISDDAPADAYGDRGFFKRDTLYATNTAGVGDDNIVGLGKTKIQITEAGDYTFWVRSDDGFALRVKNGTFSKVTGAGGAALIDPADSSTIAFFTGTGNADTRGVINLTPGEYEIDFLWFEGGGGSYAEVSWAQGDHMADPKTGRWKLVGGADTTPFFPAAPLSEPALPTGNAWAVRNYYAGGDVPTLRDGFARIASPGTSLIADAVTPVVNFQDPNTPVSSDGLFSNNVPFPMEAAITPAVDDNQFVTVARHSLTVPTAGDYTFAITADDGVAFRILGGPYLINHAGPMNNNSGIDPLDPTAFLNSANSAASSFGAYRFPAAGTYTVEVVHVEQVGGAGLEVAWTAGEHTSRNSTSAWTLLGNPSDPSLPTPVPVMPNNLFASLPGTSGENGDKWSIAFVYPNPAGAVGSLGAAFAVAQNPASTRTNVFAPYLNHVNYPATASNPNFGGNAQGLLRSNQAAPYQLDEQFFQGAGLLAYVDNMMVLATARINVTTGGLHTFGVNTDDGFALRIVGAPAGFRRLSGTPETVIDMAQPNTIFRSGGTASNRAVIDLPAGEYDVQFAYYEAGGNAGFELFSAAGDFTNEGDTNTWRAIGNVANGGLSIIPNVVAPSTGPTVSNFVFNAGTGAFSFNFSSSTTVNYDIEYSDDLVTWHVLRSVTGGDGTTSVEGTVAELTQVTGTRRVFFRVKTN